MLIGSIGITYDIESLWYLPLYLSDCLQVILLHFQIFRC